MCTQTKPVRHQPWGTAQSLPIPQEPQTDIALDFIVGLPESWKSDGGKSYNSILVIVARFSKMARYIDCEKVLVFLIGLSIGWVFRTVGWNFGSFGTYSAVQVRFKTQPGTEKFRTVPNRYGTVLKPNGTGT